VHLRGDVEDPLRDDSVEDDRARLLLPLQGVDELAYGDLRDDDVPLIEEARGGGPPELDEHVAVLLQLRAQDLRRRRQRRRGRLADFPELARLRPRFRPRFRARLGAWASLEPTGWRWGLLAGLGELALRLVHRPGEAVHL